MKRVALRREEFYSVGSQINPSISVKIDCSRNLGYYHLKVLLSSNRFSSVERLPKESGMLPLNVL